MYKILSILPFLLAPLFAANLIDTEELEREKTIIRTYKPQDTYEYLAKFCIVGRDTKNKGEYPLRHMEYISTDCANIVREYIEPDFIDYFLSIKDANNTQPKLYLLKRLVKSILFSYEKHFPFEGKIDPRWSTCLSDFEYAFTEMYDYMPCKDIIRFRNVPPRRFLSLSEKQQETILTIRAFQNSIPLLRAINNKKCSLDSSSDIDGIIDILPFIANELTNEITSYNVWEVIFNFTRFKYKTMGFYFTEDYSLLNYSRFLHDEAVNNLLILTPLIPSIEETEANEKEAFAWYKKAAQQGYATSQSQIGDFYYFGNFTQRNLKKSFFWHKKAADQGYAKSQYAIAEFYYHGLGDIQEDPEKASFWYEKAADQKHEKARLKLQKIKPRKRGKKRKANTEIPRQKRVKKITLLTRVYA